MLVMVLFDFQVIIQVVLHMYFLMIVVILVQIDL